MDTFKASNLTIGYKNKSLFSNLNFEIKSGTLTSLLGSNGIGKSTLLKTLSNLLQPIYGNLYINNVEIKTYKPEAFAKLISVVLTNQLVNKDLTVYELVKLGRQPYTNWLDKLSDIDESIINTTLQNCEISSIKDKKLSQISDGQLQRCFIARAVAQDTPFIFLDEPSNHLDLYHKVQLFKLLKKLCLEKNKCILFSTHDLDLAIQLSDEIMLLRSNKFYHDSTNNLINEGIFDNFFNCDDITFDRNYKRFIVR